MNGDVVLITVNTTNEDSLRGLADVLDQQYPETRFIISAEEFKVTDLDKLEAQLRTLLGYVTAIKDAKQEESKAAKEIHESADGVAARIMEALIREQGRL